ncbi:MAG: alpha/beta hydrolase, partial [Dehalococcoidia bacterium]
MSQAPMKLRSRRPGYHDYSAVLIVLIVAALLIVLDVPFGGGKSSEKLAGTTPSRTEFSTLYSAALGREMPLDVFLPPGYDSSDQRYPVLYMLHGMGGTNKEWEYYGLFEEAGRLMRAGEMIPFIVVLPQGDYGYWVDQANGGPRWGEYVAREVVAEVDRRYRTLPDPSARAVGGLSMGADGALQLALNNPDVFSVVGAHSPVLKPYGDAPEFFGDVVYFEAHYPVTLVQFQTEVAKRLTISIDVGDVDIWLTNAVAFHEELNRLGVRHEWHVWPGEHNAEYWTAHVVDNLRF